MRAAIRIVLAFAVAAAASGQPAAEPPGVSGIVLDAKTGAPLRKVYVTLRQGKRAPVLAMTAADGRFAYRDVPDGDCTIQAEHVGYATRTVPATVEAKAKQRTVVRLALEPLAAIHGRVLDDEGDPLPNVRVRILRDESAFGRHYLTLVKTVGAASDGAYRADDLEAGRYLIHAESTALAAVDGVKQIPRAAFYPGVALPAQANAVEAVGGLRIDGVDVRLEWKPAYAVRGRVEMAEKQAFSVKLYPDYGIYVAGWSGRDASIEGETFELQNVPEGDYRIEAVSGENRALQGGFDLALGADAPRLRIALEPLPRIDVRVSGAGGEGCRQPEWALLPLSHSVTPLTLTGGQSLRARAGTYRPVLQSTLGGKCYVAEVSYNGQPVTGPVAVAGDGVWEARVEAEAGSIEGWVLTHEMQIAPGATVVVLPESDEPVRPFLLTATTDAEGGFVLAGLPPGAYRILARETWRAPDEWEDLAPLKQRATPVRVERKSSVRTILRMD